LQGGIQGACCKDQLWTFAGQDYQRQSIPAIPGKVHRMSYSQAFHTFITISRNRILFAPDGGED